MQKQNQKVAEIFFYDVVYGKMDVCSNTGNDYHCNNWNLALSGEFWGRSKEVLSINMCEAIADGKSNLNDYGVVGRQASRYHIRSGGTLGLVSAVNPVVPLIEPAATINESQNAITLLGSTPVIFPTTFPTGLVDGTVATNRIPEDLDEALNICGAAASKAFTGKVFAQFGYTWNDNRYTPNLSFIGSAEFTGCTNSAVQMWSAGLQGSLNF